MSATSSDEDDSLLKELNKELESEFDDGTNSFNTQAPGGKDVKYMDISGNYLTLDLRYFFPQKK